MTARLAFTTARRGFNQRLLVIVAMFMTISFRADWPTYLFRRFPQPLIEVFAHSVRFLRAAAKSQEICLPVTQAACIVSIAISGNAGAME